MLVSNLAYQLFFYCTIFLLSALSNRTCAPNFSKSNKTLNSIPATTNTGSSAIASHPKLSSGQSSRKASNFTSAKASTNEQHCPRSVAIMTSSKPTTEQQTSHATGHPAHTSDATSINRERFGRTVSLNTSCSQKQKQTSHIMVDNVSNSTSLNEDHLKRTVGLTTSTRQKTSICNKHTSNIYSVASARTSVQQQMNRSIGLITSRQNSPPIHNKACSNIIKCASGKTSMYDELNTQSIGIVNSNIHDYFGSETSTHLEEQCVQSVGVINTAWKGKAAIKTIRSPHAFDTQSSELGFLLSPKEYEALYKTTRYLSKEAAKATTAIKEENLGYQHNSNQSDAAVEVMLRADMKSAQNMTSPAMHSATVMTVPSASSEFDSTSPTPSCSAKYPLEIPTRDNDNADSNVKNHLAASCRYYSTLLTKQLDNVKENLTKHLVTPDESPMDIPLYCEACTMKPSAREEFGCQTFKDRAKEKPNVLDPSENETDICRHDKAHLQSVYYMLTAIEGRLRRLKSNVEYNS